MHLEKNKNSFNLSFSELAKIRSYTFIFVLLRFKFCRVYMSEL